jgi:hypothetical protein
MRPIIFKNKKAIKEFVDRVMWNTYMDSPGIPDQDIIFEIFREKLEKSLIRRFINPSQKKCQKGNFHSNKTKKSQSR